MSRAVEEDIVQKLEDARDNLLAGVPNWDTYLREHARYQVLKTLVENERERLKNLEIADNGAKLEED